MPIRDEDTSNQKDISFNPLLGDDRSCQGAVGGDIDGKDTASSINNDNGMYNEICPYTSYGFLYYIYLSCTRSN